MPVYIVDKPLGLSSHDVVAKARKQLQTRRVGHAGTLDPLASGVLVVLAHEATKLSPFLTESSKHYLAWISFGAQTPTLDAEGPVEISADASALTHEDILKVLPDFLAIQEQRPPSHSAIKKQGVKGYEAARQGVPLDLPARPARYHVLTLLDFAATREELPKRFSVHGTSWQPDVQGQHFALPPTLGNYPTALLYTQVQAGTYIRALARDIGEALGLPAHLSGLVRTRAGNLALEHALPLDKLTSSAPSIPLPQALPYPILSLSSDEARRVKLGQRLHLTQEQLQHINPNNTATTPRFGLCDASGLLVAVAQLIEGRMKLLRVWT